MSDVQPTESLSVINYRLTAIEKAIESISKDMKQLVLLEQKHVETREAIARLFREQEAHESRLKAIEAELPTLKLARGWAIAAVAGPAAVIGLALLRMVSH